MRSDSERSIRTGRRDAVDHFRQSYQALLDTVPETDRHRFIAICESLVTAGEGQKFRLTEKTLLQLSEAFQLLGRKV